MNMGSIKAQCKGYARLCCNAILNALPVRPFTDSSLMTPPNDISMKTNDVLRVELEVMRREHRDLDEAIHALAEKGTADPLTLQRLKRNKLRLKDKIAQIEDRLTPDIIA
jgi:hypothetical protein